jgi:hypothetical protein
MYVRAARLRSADRKSTTKSTQSQKVVFKPVYNASRSFLLEIKMPSMNSSNSQSINVIENTPDINPIVADYAGRRNASIKLLKTSYESARLHLVSRIFSSISRRNW